MATKHFCDICDKEIEVGSSVECQFWGTRTGNDDDIELCHKCYCDLRYFIQMRKEKYYVEYKKPELYL